MDFVYDEDHEELKEIALSKTLCALGTYTPELILHSISASMMKDLSLALMKGCVAPSGWDEGLGFDGVENATSARKFHASRRRGNAIKAVYVLSSDSSNTNTNYYDTTDSESGGGGKRRWNEGRSAHSFEREQEADFKKFDLFVHEIQNLEHQEVVLKKERGN